MENFAPSGQGLLFAGHTQGVALGFPIKPLRGTSVRSDGSDTMGSTSDMNLYPRSPIRMNSLLKQCLFVCAAIGFSASNILIVTLRAEDLPKIRKDVVYGHKDGMALTLDVFEPEYDYCRSARKQS